MVDYSSHLALSNIRDGMQSLGFKKRAGDIFTLDLENQWMGFAGLNMSSKYHEKGHRTVNPVVGIRHGTIEKLVSELVPGRPYRPYSPPTVSYTINSVIPPSEERFWRINPEDSNGNSFKVLRAIETLGLPYIKSSLDLDVFEERLRNGHGGVHPYPYRGLIFLVLTRRTDFALEELKRISLNTKKYQISETRYEKFSEAFRSWIEKTDEIEYMVP